MSYRYSIVAPTSMTIRADHNTLAGAAVAGRNLPAGIFAYGDELWVAPATGTLVMQGDTWLRVRFVENNDLPIDGWVAVIHLGHVYCTLTDDGTVTPPPPIPIPPEAVNRIVSVEVTYKGEDGLIHRVECFPR